MTSSASYEKSKSLGSGGSMVARLKLKEIDGRAPPGKNYIPLLFICVNTVQLKSKNENNLTNIFPFFLLNLLLIISGVEPAA